MESLRGQLLIATPVIVDPNFRRTVVLLAEHSEEGAMGLVLNQPSESLVADAVPPLVALVDGGEPVYVGGPVEPSAVIVLADFEDPAEAGSLVVGSIGFLIARHRAGAVVGGRAADAGGAPATRAGARCKLEAEEAWRRRAWFVEPALPDDAFADPDQLWADVLRRKGGEYSVIAMMPDDRVALNPSGAAGATSVRAMAGV